MDGALVVVSGDVHPGKFYFCADDINCVTGSGGDLGPGYSNVMQPVSFGNQETIQRMASLGISVT